MQCLCPQPVKDEHGKKMYVFQAPDGSTYEGWELPNILPECRKLLRPIAKLYPCGRCAACLRNRAAEWSFRMEVHLKHSRGACYFITLTFDDEHLPHNKYGIPGFDKDIARKFLKDLRNAVRGHQIKYYMVCEYGGKTHRPHHHLIVFDWPYSETALGVIKKDKLIGSVLTRVWPYGQVDIGEATSASITYVAEYILSKPSIPYHWDTPFNLISKGIGAQWLNDKNKNMYYRELPSSIRMNQKVVKTPRYYIKKLPLSLDEERIKQAQAYIAMKLERNHEELLTPIELEEKNQSEIDFVKNTFRKFNKGNL